VDQSISRHKSSFFSLLRQRKDSLQKSSFGRYFYSFFGFSFSVSSSSEPGESSWRRIFFC
jgi:hypothetical protein